MTGWPRRTSVVFLFAAITAALSCTSGDSFAPETSPTVPEAVLSSAPEQPPARLLGGLVEDLANLHLLSCSPQPYVSVTQTVGPDGATILVGTHELVIPAGALTGRHTIRAEQVTARVNSVRFSPEGLTFAVPARLTLSYANCSPLLLLKRVVYTDEQLRILELIPSIDNLLTKTVTGRLRHFSRYAVAW